MVRRPDRTFFQMRHTDGQQTHEKILSITEYCEVAQSCLTLCDPMNCSPPGFSIHGIFQASVLE